VKESEVKKLLLSSKPL